MTRNFFISLIFLLLAATYLIWGVLASEPFRIWVGILHVILSFAFVAPEYLLDKLP